MSFGMESGLTEPRHTHAFTQVASAGKRGALQYRHDFWVIVAPNPALSGINGACHARGVVRRMCVTV